MSCCFTLALILLAWPPTLPAPDELIFADGRREPVEDARKDSKGQWVGTREGRRVVLEPGEIVAIVDAKGAETVIVPELSDAPVSAQHAAILASLRDVKNDGWLLALVPLGSSPTRGVHDALVALSKEKNKALRGRAIRALCALHTKASVMAAADAVLGEKDVGLRRESASALFSVEEIFRRCESLRAVESGLADADAGVRLVFAMLSPRDHAAATGLLRDAGLKHRDHHIRESSAYELALRGDGAGEGILISMLERARLPGVEGDEALMIRLLIQEHVRVCAVLGKLATKAGKAALEKALKSPHEPVRKAAQAALDAPAAK